MTVLQSVIFGTRCLDFQLEFYIKKTVVIYLDAMSRFSAWILYYKAIIIKIFRSWSVDLDITGDVLGKTYFFILWNLIRDSDWDNKEGISDCNFCLSNFVLMFSNSMASLCISSFIINEMLYCNLLFLKKKQGHYASSVSTKY
jgi:hypothetical protein